MKVHCDWSASGFQIIADDQFNPAVHVPFDAPKPVSPVEAAPVGTDADDRPLRRKGR